MTNDVESTQYTPASGDDPVTEGSESKRRWFVWALIGLASLIAVGAGLNVWVHNQLLNTDRWVEASNELLADDEVRAALATYLVDELYAAVDVSAELEENLPDDFKGLAGPISAALRGPATDGVDRLLNTSAARAVWDTANRKAHETIVAVLRDEGDVVSTTGGVVTLELGGMVRDLGADLGLPSGLLDSIPPDTGQIVLIESSELQTAQQVVRVIEWLSVFLFLAVVALYAAAGFLSEKSQRRATLRDVGWALVISGLVLLLLRRAGLGLAVDSLAETEAAEGAVRAAAEIGTVLLRQMAWSGIAAGVLIAGYAILTGPTKAATATRRAVAPLFASVALTWILAAGVLYLIMNISPGFALDAWATGLVFIGLYVTAFEVLRRSLHREFPDASFGDQWARIRAKVGRDSS